MTLNQGYSYRHVVGARAAGQSLAAYLAEQFAHSDESLWQSRIDAGEVVLADRPAQGHEVPQAGDVVVWNRPAWDEPDVPQDFGLIYQDDHLLVVNKPSGLPTLPGGGFLQHTLLSLVRTRFPAAHSLHRLGRATSGLVLFALDTASAAKLSRNWSRFHKQYRALASGVASGDVYDIQAPIGPRPHPRLGHIHAASPRGKPAHSIARVLERRAESTLFEVDLMTGRPHQIRIHLAVIGQPLVGDTLYAPGGGPLAENPGLPGDAGYWLHAARVVFEHPVSGESLDLTAPPPEILCSRAPVDG